VIFLLVTMSSLSMQPTQPPIQWVLLEAHTTGVKNLKNEADHSPPSRAGIKNM